MFVRKDWIKMWRIKANELIKWRQLRYITVISTNWDWNEKSNFVQIKWIQIGILIN